jgi:hypothetical protein
LVNPEPLTDLLRTPALRSVVFDDFSFTTALCHAVADALEEGSTVTDITFDSDCSFPDGGAAIIANALNTNASVTDVNFHSDFDDFFYNILAAVLLCNSTLQNITLYAAIPARSRWLSSTFLSLGMNTTLKRLTVGLYDKLGDELCEAMRIGLAKNSTLEELSLRVTIPSGDDGGAVPASNALSFLRTNSTLKSLKVYFVRVQPFVQAQMESYVFAFRLEAVKILEENPSLESLAITVNNCKIKFEELFALISALQLNTTLKTLDCGCQHYSKTHYCLSDDEVKQLVPILMKNYGLEHLVPDISCADDRSIKAILRLNKAGRRYLIKDGSSISKGVEVLSAVNDDINCVFVHLLEKRACATEGPWRPRRRRKVGGIVTISSNPLVAENESELDHNHVRKLALD